MISAATTSVELFTGSMFLHVCSQVAFSGKLFFADGADVRLGGGVCRYVDFQISFRPERLGTLWTWKRLFTRVNSLVILQQAVEFEILAARLATVRFVVGVRSEVVVLEFAEVVVTVSAEVAQEVQRLLLLRLIRDHTVLPPHVALEMRLGSKGQIADRTFARRLCRHVEMFDVKMQIQILGERLPARVTEE